MAVVDLSEIRALDWGTIWRIRIDVGRVDSHAASRLGIVVLHVGEAFHHVLAGAEVIAA